MSSRSLEYASIPVYSSSTTYEIKIAMQPHTYNATKQNVPRHPTDSSSDVQYYQYIDYHNIIFHIVIITDINISPPA